MKPCAELVPPALARNHAASSGREAMGGGTHTVVSHVASTTHRQLDDRALAAELPTPESAYEFVYSPEIDPTSAAFATAAKQQSRSR